MLVKSLIICTLVCILSEKLTLAAPSDLVATTESNNGSKDEKAPENVNVQETQIYEMKVETNVTNRFAKTIITSRVKNPNKFGKEATFSVVLPEKAFISEFVMEIGGKQYKAYIKEKEEAKKTYDSAVSQGQSAAHVSVSARDSNRFTVSVNVEAAGKATFYLTYEELLDRKLDQYEIVLNIQPGQPVKDLGVRVNINETRPLKFVRAPALRSGNEITKNDKDGLDPNANIQMLDKNNAVVKFQPDIKKQQSYAKELGTDEKNGLAGQFVVQYDVERDPHGGEILLNEGFFVHFFSPDTIELLPKYVIFVFDTSGSMYGIRIQQLQQSMENILSNLKPEDKFSVVEFASTAKVWDIVNGSVAYESVNRYDSPLDKELKSTKKIPAAFDATPENIAKAKQVVKNLSADGGTDIDDALKLGLKLVEQNKQDKNQPLIIFLTDGEATVGEQNNDNIIKDVTKLNAQQTPIFTLSFGDGADKKFLEKISLKNAGFARHIYEGADANIQLEKFYQIISSPLLTNIKFKYVSNVTEVTKTNFPIIFRGGEIIVAGKFNDPTFDPGFAPRPNNQITINITFPSTVEGVGNKGKVVLEPHVQTPVTSLERLWAYLTIRQLLEKLEVTDDKKQLKQEALDLALKYSFVTDLTSLVVVKPNDTSSVDTVDASKPIALPGRFPLQRPMHNLYGGSSASSAYGGIAPLQSFGAGAPNRAFLTHRRGGYRLRRPTPLAEPIYLTTTFKQPTFPPTSIHTSTTEITNTVYQKLIKSLSWLVGILSADGTLTTPQGELKLNLDEDVTNTTSCPLTPLNQRGICQPLAGCVIVHDKLTDLQVFLKHSCKLKTLTGICCPL